MGVICLSHFTSYYRFVINVPVSIVQQLLPLFQQCKADTLRTSKIYLCHQVDTLKKELDVAYDQLLQKLTGVSDNSQEKFVQGRI